MQVRAKWNRAGVNILIRKSFSCMSLSIDGHICWNSKRLPTKESKLPFSVCRKQTEVCRFRFFYSVCSKQRDVAIFSSVFRIYIYICRYVYIETAAYRCIGIYVYHMLPFQMENGKWKPRRFFFIWLPFAHHTNWSCRLSVCLWRNKWKLSVCKLPKRTCPSITLSRYSPCTPFAFMFVAFVLTCILP